MPDNFLGYAVMRDGKPLSYRSRAVGLNPHSNLAGTFEATIFPTPIDAATAAVDQAAEEARLGITDGPPFGIWPVVICPGLPSAAPAGETVWPAGETVVPAGETVGPAVETVGPAGETAGAE